MEDEIPSWDEEHDITLFCASSKTELVRYRKRRSSPELAVMQLCVKDLQRRLSALEATIHSQIVPIQSLSPHPLDVRKHLNAVVSYEDGAYVASFIDANINGSGDTLLDAVEMLKEMIASTYLFFEANEASLGSEPQRQLNVLREFIKSK